ncbi:NADPH-dependent FMN reductase [Sphingopyxis sp.]|uniref:NADPH-dependent FMN reductase n=1 Tax=Sphingopyxis sp. TaxID=1908224 RepID=UPI003D0ECBD9
MSGKRPLIVAIGGNATPGGSAERLLRETLARCETDGAETRLFAGEAIDLPMYAPHRSERDPRAEALTSALRAADGIIIASPAYHGTVSGVVKNVLDYAQDLVTDAQPYFDGRAVGLIAVAGGWQAAGSTLATLRSITHALRGWPTPMAITANSSQTLFDPDGVLTDLGIASQLDIMTGQVMTFARMKHAYAAATAKTAQLA